MKLITVFLLILVCLQLKAQDKAPVYLIQNPDARESISLEGKWHYLIDSYQNGYLDYRLEPTNEGYAKNEKVNKETDRIEYNFETAPLLNVPGNWNTQKPELLCFYFLKT